ADSAWLERRGDKGAGCARPTADDRLSEGRDFRSVTRFDGTIGASGDALEPRSITNDEPTARGSHDLVTLQNMKAVGDARTPYIKSAGDVI
ncbi:hypothetical protein, partial [Escherichia coli]|uniref:hypothetical protein n=1 Tax=Escherichia coli TaxID=562 RepID=UPI0019531333